MRLTILRDNPVILTFYDAGAHCFKVAQVASLDLAAEIATDADGRTFSVPMAWEADTREQAQARAERMNRTNLERTAETGVSL